MASKDVRAVLKASHSRQQASGHAILATAGGDQSPKIEGPLDRFMPRSEVISVTGLSDTTLWREYRAGRFPKPYPLTKNRCGWLESEVRDWMQKRLRAVHAG